MTARLVTCVLAALGVCAMVYSEGESSVYRDPQQRFTLHVPNGWNVAPIGDAVQLSRGNAYASLVVSNGGSDPTSLVANLAGQISRQWRNFTELKRGDSTLAGQRAAFGFYSGVTPKGQDSLMKIVATVVRQKSFVFIMSAPTGEFSAVKAGFDEIEREFSVGAAPSAAGPAGDDSRLAALDAAYKAGVLTRQEYEAKRRELLAGGGATSPGTRPASPSPVPPMTAGPTPARPAAPQPPQAAAAPTAARPSAGVIRLRPHVVMDPVMGMEAFRFLVPVDWKVEGGVVWRHVPTRPAAANIRAFNPNGVEEIGVLPDVPCVWAQTLPAFRFPEGSNYIGNEVRRPINDAIQAIRLMIVPRYRPHLRTATIVKQEPLPELAKAWAAAEFPDVPQAEANIRAGRVRFTYQQSGKTVEEDVYTVVGWFTVPIQGVPTTFWGLDAIRYGKAEKGTLDQQYKLFQTISYSTKPNLAWFNRYAQVREMMIQNQMEASNQAVQLSRYLSRTNAQISDTIRQSYERRQAAMDRVNANWDRHIRGVDDYRNPWGGANVQLPSGYSHVWANAKGEYILSDSTTFNPNIGTNREWRPMERVH